MNTELKTIVINGDHFCDLQSFYNEVERTLSNGSAWRSDNNLMAFKRLLAGELGILNPGEKATLIWKNTNKSKNDFNRIANGLNIYLTILDIIKSQKHIKYIEQ
jgi:RNAse (barnase) inhibitor barstar